VATGDGTRNLRELSDMAFKLAIELTVARMGDRDDSVVTGLDLLDALALLRLTLVFCDGPVNEAKDAYAARVLNLIEEGS
jgi:hypothetical protein